MLKTIRQILQKSNNISRSTYFWNTLNATVSAVQSAIILMVITRTNGVIDAGIFSIAYAIANLMLYIGQYGIRKFQASDIKEEFQYADYLGMRIITCGAMMIASLAYAAYGLFFNDYTTEKFLVIVLICLVKTVQAFADVYHGRMQQNGRLDVAARASSIRIIIGTLAYLAALIITRNMVLSTVIWLIVVFILFIITTVNVSIDYGSMKPRFEKQSLKKLTVAGFPIFVSLFLSLYIGNAPKYAIDAYLSDKIQAYYNFVFMPAFAIQLLTNFIFNPILTSYAKIWNEKNFKQFIKVIKKQVIIVLGITVVGFILAYLFGIPVLSIIFGVDLSSYKMELCVVMIGGGMLAYVSFFTTILTIIRHQNILLIGYIITAIIVKLLSRFFVVNYGIMGAVTLYATIMGILALGFVIAITIKIKQDIKKELEGGYHE